MVAPLSPARQAGRLQGPVHGVDDLVDLGTLAVREPPDASNLPGAGMWGRAFLIGRHRPSR